MAERQFNALAKIIYDRAGIHFPIAKKYVLESRLAQRLEELELDNYDEYISFLTMGPYQVDEFQEMFNRITINETSFFRNEPQLDVFERRILPELLEARKTSKRLRIWSAACSTGEEPYTLAMLVHRTLGVRLPDWRVEILGTDISERCIDTATEANYTEYAVRTTSPANKAKYFTQSGPYWKLSDSIKQMVNFEIHNLKDRLAAKRHGTWDVIFCRNVMIYFDAPTQRRVLERIHAVMKPKGLLYVGHSENFSDSRELFRLRGKTIYERV